MEKKILEMTVGELAALARRGGSMPAPIFDEETEARIAEIVETVRNYSKHKGIKEKFAWLELYEIYQEMSMEEIPRGERSGYLRAIVERGGL